MRVLTQNECDSVQGAFGYTLIEGFCFDDFAIVSGMLGLVGSWGLGIYARKKYNQTPIPLSEIASCTLLTAWQGAKYGLIIDGALGVVSLAMNAIS